MASLLLDEPMAKNKKANDPLREPEPRPASGRKNVLVVQGTEAWRDWLKRFATFRRLSVVATVDQAIIESASKHGFTEPAPPR
jgi:hypothetical protein